MEELLRSLGIESMEDAEALAVMAASDYAEDVEMMCSRVESGYA